MTVVPIAPREEFTTVLAAVPTLAEETYREYAKDITMIDRNSRGIVLLLYWSVVATIA